jgi:diaminopimelate decarboxylase
MCYTQETLFQKQARLIADSIPELFSPSCSVRLVTENGRALLAKAGCVASSVEYTKSSGGRHIAVTHVGADLCMRACYMPDTWGLRVFVCDAEGRQKEGAAGVEDVVQDIAGPLCFQVSWLVNEEMNESMSELCMVCSHLTPA